MLVLMAFLALGSASAVKLEKSESVNEESSRLFVTPNKIEESSRLYFTSNNLGSFLALNATVLTVGVLLVLIVLVGYLVIVQGGLLGNNQYSRYGN